MSLTHEIKADFGRRLREARDSKRYSRQVLGMRLGVSPKTIQSWEMGRTFIENLSLIPAIERELDISISKMIDDSTRKMGMSVNESAPAYGAELSRDMPLAGPLPVSFETSVEPGQAVSTEAFCAVPVIKPVTLSKEVAALTKKDIVDYTMIPKDWMPRGSILVGIRMADSTMEPMIAHGATVIVDRRELDPDKALDKVVAMLIQNRGVRIRKFEYDEEDDMYIGLPCGGRKRRGKIPFNPEKGDLILGKIVGVMSTL